MDELGAIVLGVFMGILACCLCCCISKNIKQNFPMINIIEIESTPSKSNGSVSPV